MTSKRCCGYSRETFDEALSARFVLWRGRSMERPAVAGRSAVRLVRPHAGSGAAVRDRAAIAADVLACALGWEPNVRLIGNVQAAEVARLAASVLITCHHCGSDAWVNIDCDVCIVVGQLIQGEIP